jgi:glutathione reductase (NADPH)
MIIVGSGYIAIEFASIFNALGVEVHLLIRGDRVFRAADKELGMQLTHDLAASGIIIHTKTTIKEVGANWVKINEDVVLTAEKIVNATGRVANVSRLNLHQAGIDQQDDGSIIVDDGFLTSRGDVYAVGDVINRYNLTPVAIAQGRALAEHWFNNKPFIYDENFISTAVFSTPEVATVGLSEEQAKGQYGDDNVAIYRSHFKPMKYTLTDDNNAKVMYKIVVEKSSGKLLGVHLLGENSAELIQTISTLLRMGATKEDIDMTMAVHPTSAEELVTSYIPVS